MAETLVHLQLRPCRPGAAAALSGRESYAQLGAEV